MTQKDHLRELFRCAVARQTEVMVQNILGNGIDIPLLGLREASREVTGDLHELFTDESYQISQCFLLSTSQVHFWQYSRLYVITFAPKKKKQCIACMRTNGTDKLKSTKQSLVYYVFYFGIYEAF